MSCLVQLSSEYFMRVVCDCRGCPDFYVGVIPGSHSVDCTRESENRPDRIHLMKKFHNDRAQKFQIDSSFLDLLS